MFAAAFLCNPVAASSSEDWFQALIDEMRELTAETSQDGEDGTESLDDWLNQGYGAESAPRPCQLIMKILARQ